MMLLFCQSNYAGCMLFPASVGEDMLQVTASLILAFCWLLLPAAIWTKLLCCFCFSLLRSWLILGLPLFFLHLLFTCLLLATTWTLLLCCSCFPLLLLWLLFWLSACCLLQSGFCCFSLLLIWLIFNPAAGFLLRLAFCSPLCMFVDAVLLCNYSIEAAVIFILNYVFQNLQFYLYSLPLDSLVLHFLTFFNN